MESLVNLGISEYQVRIVKTQYVIHIEIHLDSSFLFLKFENWHLLGRDYFHNLIFSNSFKDRSAEFQHFMLILNYVVLENDSHVNV